MGSEVRFGYYAPPHTFTRAPGSEAPPARIIAMGLACLAEFIEELEEK